MFLLLALFIAKTPGLLSGSLPAAKIMAEVRGTGIRYAKERVGKKQVIDTSPSFLVSQTAAGMLSQPFQVLALCLPRIRPSSFAVAEARWTHPAHP